MLTGFVLIEAELVEMAPQLALMLTMSLWELRLALIDAESRRELRLVPMLSVLLETLAALVP